MQGFDYDRTRTALKVPHGFQVEEKTANLENNGMAAIKMNGEK
jgi:hypothetical protein